MSKELLKFTIPLEPRTKKNSMRPRLAKGGRFLGMMQSEIYEKYEADCKKCIPNFARVGIDYPVNVKAIYYRQTRRTVDISNLHSALHDVLVKTGVLVDDSYKIVVGTDGSRVRFDKIYPRTEVEITEATDEEYQCNLFREMEDF